MNKEHNPIFITRETVTEHSKSLLREELRILKGLCFGELYDDHLVLKILSGRIKKRSYRVDFIQCLYNYIIDSKGVCPNLNNYQFWIKIPFLLEGVLSVQYHHNNIFDGKRGTNDRLSIRHDVLSGNLLERTLYNYIKKYLHPNDSIWICVEQILSLTDIGQFLETRYNTYKQFCSKSLKLPRDLGKLYQSYNRKQCFQTIFKQLKQGIPEGKHTFLWLYLKRVSLTSAALFVKSTELICGLTGLDPKTQENLLDYAYYIGMLLQIVNDCIDCVPSQYNPDNKAGKAEDCWCDLKNSYITLPLIHFLSTSGKKDSHILRVLQNPVKFIEPEEEILLFNEICPSVTNYVLKNCEYLAEVANNCVELEIGESLIGKTSIAFDNLFTKTVDKIKNGMI